MNKIRKKSIEVENKTVKFLEILDLYFFSERLFVKMKVLR